MVIVMKRINFIIVLTGMALLLGCEDTKGEALVDGDNNELVSIEVTEKTKAPEIAPTIEPTVDTDEMLSPDSTTSEITEIPIKVFSDEMEDGEILTREELDEISENIYSSHDWLFLLSAYDTPEEIDWDTVFYSRAGLERAFYSDEDLEKYLAEMDEEEIEYDLLTMSGEDVRDFVKEKTGIENFDVSQLTGWVYLEDSDILMTERSDCISPEEFEFEEGRRKDNRIEIHVNKSCLSMIIKDDGSYQFVSNKDIWQEKAMDIEGVPNNSYGTDIYVLLYDYYPEIRVVADNEFIFECFPNIAETKGLFSYVLNDAKFYDVDNDGREDLIIILEYDDDEPHIIICRVLKENGELVLSDGNDAVSELVDANVEDKNIDSVLKYIKDHEKEIEELYDSME